MNERIIYRREGVTSPATGTSPDEAGGQPKVRLSSHSYRQAVGGALLDKYRKKAVEMPAAMEGVEDDEKKSSSDDAQPVSAYKLFRFATGFDWFLMFLGAVSAVIHGSAFPVSMIVFGEITNAFVDHAASLTLVQSTATAFLIPNTNLSCSINFSNLTGGAVDCSATYSSSCLPSFTLEDILTATISNTSNCLDNEMFIDAVNFWVYIFIAIAVGAFLFGVVQVWFFQTAAERQAHRIRLQFYHALLKQDITWYDSYSTGELANRFNDGVSAIHKGIGDNFVNVIQWTSTFFVAFIVGFIKDWRLTLVLIGVTPLLFISGLLFAKAGAWFSAREQSAYATAGAVAEEVLSSMRTVAAFGGEPRESQRYDSQLQSASRNGVLKGFTVGGSVSMLYFSLLTAYAVAFWFGGWLISQELAATGDVLTVFFAILIGVFVFAQASPNLQIFADSTVSAGFIYKLIDREPPIDSSSKEGLKPEKFDSTIELKNVSFNYPTRPDVKILDGLSLKVDVGQTVALVGPSGSGKSTVVQLLQRFYDANEGEVLIGGENIKNLNIKWLRDNIGVVSQEPVLFDTTIAENIRYGQEDASMEDIEQAARSANAHEFVSQLPDGYNTLTGERGAQLSGGQKQRIAIARALVRNPKILLLDEATSALDTQSESVVQEALDRASEGRTTIVIAHRLSTIQNADVIVTMEKGKSSESGTHSELMASKGLYFDLVNNQSRGTILPPPEVCQYSRMRATTIRFKKRKRAVSNQERLRRFSTQVARSIRLTSSPRSERRQRQATWSGPARAKQIERGVEGGGEGGGGMEMEKRRLRFQTSALDEKETHVEEALEGDSTLDRITTAVEEIDGGHDYLADEDEEEEEAPSVSIFRLIGLIPRQIGVIVIGSLASLINGCIFPAFAIIFGEVIEVFSRPADEVLAGTHLWAGLFFALGVVSAVALLSKNLCFSVSGESLTTKVRSLLFQAILRQEPAWFDDERNSSASLITRLSDAADIQGAAGVRVGNLIEVTTQLLFAFAIGFAYNWVLTFVLVGVMPVVAIGSVIHFSAASGSRNKTQKSDYAETVVVSLQNIQTVTSFGLQPTFEQKLTEKVVKAHKLGLFLSFILGITYAYSQSITLFAYIIAFRFGAFQVTLDPSNVVYVEFFDVYRVFAALVFGSLAVGAVGTFAPDFDKAKVAAGHAFQIIDREPFIDAYSEDGYTPGSFAGEIALNRIVFNYPARPEVQVLQKLSVTVKPGQTLALVGPSGSGKSTVVSLIERFYDPQGGGVHIDDEIVQDLNLRWLRSQIGIVSQEPVLFDCSIAENIRYGALFREVSDSEIVEAAKSANIHSFIESLPQGYSTNIGKGTQLSGGQKQRIAIARALVRNPKILLLDEATSALDTESEKVVQEALDKAREGRTSIVIAHRLSTIYNSDLIAVINRGRVEESGTHAQLMAARGLYYKLNRFQGGHKKGGTS